MENFDLLKVNLHKLQNNFETFEINHQFYHDQQIFRSVDQDG